MDFILETLKIELENIEQYRTQIETTQINKINQIVKMHSANFSRKERKVTIHMT
jgi:hypothetical protein